MSKIELLATHFRTLIWQSRDGPIKVKDMTRGHLETVVSILEVSIRRNRCYPPTHERRRHESTREFQLNTMKAELKWRDRNGL